MDIIKLTGEICDYAVYKELDQRVKDYLATWQEQQYKNYIALSSYGSLYLLIPSF